MPHPVADRPTDHRRTLWNHRIPMRDGVELAADVVLPAGDGPFPTVVTRTPYLRKPGIWMERLVAAGYAYVMVDMRGRGDSDGEFTPFVKDSDDGYDSIEWIAAQDWCNGRVGMVGLSYEGLTQWWTARARPPHLRCIAPMAIGAARLGPRPSFNSGVPHLYWAWWFHQVSGRMQQHYGAPSWEANIRHLPLRNLHEQVGSGSRWWPLYVEGKIDYLGEDFVFSDDDWADLEIPVLIAVGWWDDQTTMDTWARLQASPAAVRAQLLIGAWDHGGNRAPSRTLGGLDVSASVIDTVAHVERFLARHLKDQVDPQSARSRCQVFRTGVMRWEHLDEWPSRERAYVAWNLTSDGNARTYRGDGRLAQGPVAAGTDSYVFDPERPARDFTNLDLFAWSDPPHDQRFMFRRPDSLVYQGEPLEKALSVSGRAVFDGFVSVDAPDADLCVALLDVHPDGRMMLVGGELGSPGIQRLSMRSGTSKLLEPREIAHVEIPMVWMHHTFLPGHRIAIAISSSAFPAFTRNNGTGEDWADAVATNPAEVTVHHGPGSQSCLLLPVESEEDSR